MRITMSIAYFELVCVQNYLEARQVRLISYFSLSLESLILIFIIYNYNIVLFHNLCILLLYFFNNF